MANFDNGLPPNGTDVSDKKIFSVTINESESIDGMMQKISAVIVDK